LRRKDDGTYEPIDWDTAINEIAARLLDIRAEHGGESIFYFGGGGQGNHMPGIYASATRRALGIRYRSNALAQEKTGEAWVNSAMFGNYVRGDFKNAEVSVFLGKNPWQSHGIPEARRTIREIANDPDRKMIVVDPRRTKTAEFADIHLRVRPGTDLYLLMAVTAVLFQEGLVDKEFIADHTTGWEVVHPVFANLDVAELCFASGVNEALVREAAHLIASAGSVSVFEDLGVQMNRHSTLVSYVEKLIWVLTGNFAKEGTHFIPTSLIPLLSVGPQKRDFRTPVTGAKIVGGLTPCSSIPEEILTDHPDRFRAMIVESANPAHSMPDSPRWREALDALDLVVVIDVAMTETARHADYVLPTPTQYEKREATTFTFEFPENVFFLRQPVLDPPDGVLPEPEIHARLLEAMDLLDETTVTSLNEAMEEGADEFGTRFLTMVTTSKATAGLAPLVLYRTLGPRLGDDATGAVLWASAHQLAMTNPEAVAAAGHAGGQELFERILDGPVVFTKEDWSRVWLRVRTEDGRINLEIPELLAELRGAAEERPAVDLDYPLFLSAGERRSFTANTIFRDPGWRKKDSQGSLRVSPSDASRFGLADGKRGRLVTRRGSAEVLVEVSDTMLEGHISLPNGLGVDYPDENGQRAVRGVLPNELTSTDDRDPFVGTPWHKSVPARLEPV
jgi:anaerobic selenocysteine-containing dehydrogenase